MKPKTDEWTLKTSESQFLKENKDEQRGTADNQAIFLNGVNDTFASFIDSNQKNKHVNGAKVLIEGCHQEKIGILTKSQIKAIFDTKQRLQIRRHRRTQPSDGLCLDNSETPQFARFQKYCEANCINRKLKFVDLELDASSME